MDGDSKLYNCVITEKDDAIDQIGELEHNQENNGEHSEVKDIKIKSITGPIQFGEVDLSNIKLVSSTTQNLNIIVVEKKQSDKNGQSQFIYTFSVDEQ